jgi:hypothetical protein
MTPQTVLSLHSDKVKFVLDYIQGALPQCPPSRPLCILGQGATGKTYVMRDVCEETPVAFCHMNIEKKMLYQSGKFINPEGGSNPIPFVFQCLGLPEDIDMAETLNAYIVEFVPDLSLKAQ